MIWSNIDGNMVELFSNYLIALMIEWGIFKYIQHFYNFNQYPPVILENYWAL